MKQLSDKTRLIITIVLCSVTAVALVIFLLYNFGVFGGQNAQKNSENVRTYALIKDYTVDGQTTQTENDFSFTATTDGAAGPFTIVIDYNDEKKVVSVQSYGVTRNVPDTLVRCGYKTLKLKSLDYGKKTVTAVYSLDGATGTVTISNFVVTETV